MSIRSIRYTCKPPEGVEVRSEDVAGLSPLVHEHVNMLERYQFTSAERVKQGELRSLCHPNDIDEQIAWN